ncbi:prepilin-type N-terminal cleavage/methylation domain-containing protein [Campylobacter sputorum]|uniref:prepilin-type N-terminal cleavage/methylation domain-containing protein n=1 Tax=Campylobacter sputorum TaxID=206 RepID=UPI00053C00FE|nr:prepilin-type N-terminal cleavage/methylation domain-containing protein [Campylobacter sputorum]
MKKAFTLVEVIFVIVIMAILALISSDLLANIYKNYIHTRSINELEYKTDIALEQISKRLSHRLKGSEIARLVDSNNDKFTNTILSIKDNRPEDDKKYALEWISKSYETQILTDQKDNKVGWSGIADLNFTKPTALNETTFTSPGSKFDETFKNTLKNVYSDKFGIFFITNQKSDIKKDFGYINNSHNKIASGKIKDDNNITIKIPDGMQEVSDVYYLLNTAYAVVPMNKKDYGEKNKNKKSGENIFDLYLYYGYQPWEGENYTNGKKSLLAQDVSLFRFTQTQSGVIVMKLCMRALDTDEIDFTVCKTKAVY